MCGIERLDVSSGVHHCLWVVAVEGSQIGSQHGRFSVVQPRGSRLGRSAVCGDALRRRGGYKKASSSPAGEYPASTLTGASSTSNQWVVPMGMCTKSPSARVNARSSTWTTGLPWST